MRVIGLGSFDAVVEIGWKRTWFGPGRGIRKTATTITYDQNSYDHYGRKGPLTPLPMHILEYFFFLD